MFIVDNWRIIHRAAGWAALRTFLLVRVRFGRKQFDTNLFIKVFVVNRFLSGSEVAEILRYYECLSQMSSESNSNDGI